MKKSSVFLITVFVLLVAATIFAYFNHYLFVYRVESNQSGVEKFMGRYSRTTGPGLHLKFPHPITKVDIVNSATIRQIELGSKKNESDSSLQNEFLAFTKDEKMVDLAVSVQYRVKNPRKYVLSIANREEIIKYSCKSAVKSAVGKFSLDEILTTGKLELEKEIKNRITLLWSKYSTGLELLSVQLRDANLPSEVSTALGNIANAREEKNRSINQAITHKESKMPLAMAEASKIIEQAETYAIQRVKKAEAEAEAFRIMHSAYSKNREMVRRKLYLEMLEKVLPGVRVYVLDTDNENLNLLNLNR